MKDPMTGIDPDVRIDRVVSSTSYWPARPTLRARIREAGGDWRGLFGIALAIVGVPAFVIMAGVLIG